METGSPSRMPANTTRKKGTRSRSVSGFLRPPHSRLGVPGGSHAGMAETVSAFKKPRISAVIGRFDRAQPTEHRISGKAATMTVPPMTRRTATDSGDEQMFGAE